MFGLWNMRSTKCARDSSESWFHIKNRKKIEWFGALLAIHSCQFIHVNSFVPMHSFQFIHSFIHSFIYSFIHSFIHLNSCPFIPFNSFSQLIRFTSFVSIHSCQILHFNSFMSIQSCQFLHFKFFMSFIPFNSFISVSSFQFIHVKSFMSIHSF